MSARHVFLDTGLPPEQATRVAEGMTSICHGAAEVFAHPTDPVMPVAIGLAVGHLVSVAADPAAALDCVVKWANATLQANSAAARSLDGRRTPAQAALLQ